MDLLFQMASKYSRWFFLYNFSVSELTAYSLCNNQIATLDGFVVPNGLESLELVFFLYLSVLELTTYSLSYNQIATLDGFVVPNGLKSLRLVFFI